MRPLVVASGHAHFNEVFFEDVQVPKENLVGPKNEGWKVAMGTLSYERCFRRRRGSRLASPSLAELAKSRQIDGQPAWEQDGCASGSRSSLSNARRPVHPVALFHAPA